MKPLLLIADGDAELCDIYRSFLAERGYEVETASNGLDCLTKLRQAMPAVLVLDRELHWGGGDGVLAWLRDQGITSGVSVVLTATAGYSSDDAADLQPPVVKFLPKPFGLTALLESVRAAVANREQDEPFCLYRTATRSELFIG